MNVFRVFIQKIQVKLHNLFLELLSKDVSEFLKMNYFMTDFFFLRLSKLYSITGSPSAASV